MGRKAALATIGTGTVAASAATAASSLDSHADDYFDEEEESSEEDALPTSSEATTVTPPTQESGVSTPEASVQAQKQTGEATGGLGNWLSTTNSDNANKSKYFGTNMAFENATFGDTTSNTSIEGAGDNYFGSLTEKYQSGDYAKIKSNLEITVKRKTCSNNKTWWGEMTWFWSFENKKTNKGFITINKATTDKNKKALLLTGVFYMLEKSGEKWNVKYKKEVKESDGKYLNNSNFGKYFPKPFWYTKRGRFDEMYYTNWDFIKDANELNSLCDKPEPEPTPIRTGTWEYTSDRWWEKHWGWWGFEWYNRVYHWAGDHTASGGVQWFEFMYGKDKFKLEESLDSFFLGTWYPKKWFRSKP